MSNQVIVEPLKCENIRTGAVDYRLCISDSYGEHSVSVEAVPDDDLECLRILIREANDYVNDLFDYLKSEQKGVSVGDVFYGWEDIKGLFEEVPEQ